MLFKIRLSSIHTDSKTGNRYKNRVVKFNYNVFESTYLSSDEISKIYLLDLSLSEPSEDFVIRIYPYSQISRTIANTL